MVKLYVSLFGLGFIPFASGTIGSLAGIALWLTLREIISPWTMILAIVLIPYTWFGNLVGALISYTARAKSN